jgi:hypothetical protein
VTVTRGVYEGSGLSETPGVGDPGVLEMVGTMSVVVLATVGLSSLVGLLPTLGPSIHGGVQVLEAQATSTRISRLPARSELCTSVP